MVKSQEAPFQLQKEPAMRQRHHSTGSLGVEEFNHRQNQRAAGRDEISMLLTVSHSCYPPVFCWPLSLVKPNWKTTVQWRLADANSRGSLLRCTDGREEQRMDLDKGPAEKGQHTSTRPTIAFDHSAPLIWCARDSSREYRGSQGRKQMPIFLVLPSSSGMTDSKAQAFGTFQIVGAMKKRTMTLKEKAVLQTKIIRSHLRRHVTYYS